MDNFAKYLVTLESLKFNAGSTSLPEEIGRVELNLMQLKKHIKTKHTVLIKKITDQLKAPVQLDTEGTSSLMMYCIYLEHVILQVLNNINLQSDAKEDLISTRHLNLSLLAIHDLALYTLYSQLHPLMRTVKAFASEEVVVCDNIDCLHLQLSIELFSRVLRIKYFHGANAMVRVTRYYIASIFTLFVAHSLNEFRLSDDEMTKLQDRLNFIWLQISKRDYFRNLLLLKGCRKLPADVQKRLHQELLRKLSSSDGFTTLVTTLVTSPEADSQNYSQNNKQAFEIIANIVAFKGHSKRFQLNVMQQIFKFIPLCLTHRDPLMIESLGAGLLALRRLHDLSFENQNHISNWLKTTVEQLTEPTDLLTGLILMEYEKFSFLISQLYHLFCTSSVECLPSELLVSFLPLFLQLFDAIPSDLLQRKQVAQLVIRCLANRAPTQLHDILSKLYKQNFSTDWLKLHNRVLIKPNTEHTALTLKIAPSDYRQDFNISLSLPELLISSDHNILIYKVFISLLKLMDECLEKSPVVGNIDLLHTEQDLLTFLNTKYPAKVEIILSLNALVSHSGLKAQMAENATEFLSLLKKSLDQRISVRTSTHSDQQESADQTLLIMLTLVQEVLEYTQRPELFQDFAPQLMKLRGQTPNQLVKHRTDCLMKLERGDIKPNNLPSDITPFSLARTLIESSESYLQVYGIEKMLHLLRQRDAVTLANVHVIIALAFATLKNKESYTFLNCVRLFVALVDIKEVDVLELLSDEYLNDGASMDSRLVVGEAILKVSKELGALSYKYKDVLLNCFMFGARSQIDEFRWSSFSNLSQLCRTLSYQVHKFFNELITLIDSELSTGKYLPAKRAAVLVITEVLEGMDNISDFEEMLLPMYRLLRGLATDEQCDEKMRLHASNGLKVLAKKFKKFLFPQRELEKSIKILGIQENSKPSLKAHILEMN